MIKVKVVSPFEFVLVPSAIAIIVSLEVDSVGVFYKCGAVFPG